MMEKLIVGFPTQLVKALEIAQNSSFKPAANPIHNVVIAGMGGSGIGANLVQAITADNITVPIGISKSYETPAYISKNTLFLACSYSGGTEETIAAVKQAHEKGAQIVCVTSGGELGALADAHGWDKVVIPGHDKSPRASIGYAYVQLLNILSYFGLTKTAYRDELSKAAQLLTEGMDTIREEAKDMAYAMKDKFVFLYADSKLESVVLRTQQQIAENSKHMSHANVFPEMNHNELVGWANPTLLFENAYTLMLRSGYDHPRTGKRMDICLDIFRGKSNPVVELHAKGESFIEQAIYFIFFLDWVSFYLAEANGVDPFPVDVISFLKDELAKF